MLGPGIISPVILIAVVVPVGFTMAKRYLKEAGGGGSEGPVSAPSGRLTSNALRDLPAPPWRVVYEIGDDKLAGVEHVAIGPAGIFAIETSMDPLPDGPIEEPDAHAVAQSAIVRGDLDDALRACAMSSDRLVRVHWGQSEAGAGPSIDLLPGTVAVDGRSLGAWADSLRDERLTPAQVDLAWQTVVTAIGRPDPLA